MTSGLGMGLYISSEIINTHNGKLGVESKLGNGSTFYFDLPMEAN
jgi:two-component system phosphate regulon sensor histidine kinase PhoR